MGRGLGAPDRVGRGAGRGVGGPRGGPAGGGPNFFDRHRVAEDEVGEHVAGVGRGRGAEEGGRSFGRGNDLG
jgi:hypothetical protein